MNKNFSLVFAYQLILFLESMLLVTAIEGYKSDVFTAVLRFNLLYLPIGGVLNYGAWCLLQSLFKENRMLLQGTHIIVVLLLLNFIIYFTHHEWLLQHKSMAIIVYLLVADCYILAVLLTRKMMRQPKKIQHE